VPVAIPPREKGPRYKGWQTSTLTGDGRIAYTADGGTIVSTFEAMFGPGGNVGIVLGDPSGGLIDVDIDDPAGHAMRLAPQFLPATATFGRASKPESHWLYQCGVPAGPRESLNAPIAPLYEAHRYNAQQRSVTLVEVRGTGVQTMAPGSVHPSGERVRWDRDVTPVGIARAELDLRVARLAMAALLVQAGTADAAALRMTLAATPVELAAMAPSSAVDMVRSWPACRILRPPEPPPMVRSEVAAAGFDAAKARYNADRTPSWPNKCIPCPVCGSTASFKALSTNAAKWVCWSTNHPDGCGVATKGGDKAEFTGDALDLDSYAAGRTPKEHLLAEGYLEPYVDRLADPDLIDLVRGGELARQDWEVVRAAAPKTEKAKGKAERPRQFDGANEVRFESDSDVTLAIALCQELEAGLEAPVVGCEGTIWRYESPRWRPLKAFQIENHVAAWEGSPIPSFRGDPMPMRLGNAKIKSVVERAKVERADPEFFRDHVGAIAFRNGMATLRRGGVVVEPPSPGHRVRHVIDLEYTDKDPVHLFDLLGSCFEGCDDAAERALFLSEFVGACLAGVATRFETATILLGHGANGKSTFLNHAVRPIFPASSITAVSPQDMGKEYNRASLVGSAINIVSEMPDGDILGAEAVKAIISGETVQARHIREAPFDLNCRAGHLYAANDLPALRDFSAGFQRRWRIIGFPNVFPKDSPKRRTDWPELLTSELGAIASWYARCVARVLPDLRYTNVASSEAEVYRWVNEADSVSVWVDARCERSTATTLGAKLYVDYRNWVTSVGMRPVTIQKFGRRLSRLGVSSIHSRGGEARGLLLRFGGDAS
jgi:P4 family phage/plasmid primase-like protien